MNVALMNTGCFIDVSNIHFSLTSHYEHVLHDVVQT